MNKPTINKVTNPAELTAIANKVRAQCELYSKNYFKGIGDHPEAWAFENDVHRLTSLLELSDVSLGKLMSVATEPVLKHLGLSGMRGVGDRREESGDSINPLLTGLHNKLTTELGRSVVWNSKDLTEGTDWVFAPRCILRRTDVLELWDRELNRLIVRLMAFYEAL